LKSTLPKELIIRKLPRPLHFPMIRTFHGHLRFLPIKWIHPKGIHPIVPRTEAPAMTATLEPTIAELYGQFPIARTRGGLQFIDIATDDDYVAWLVNANPGMLSRGNLLCFDYALSHL